MNYSCPSFVLFSFRFALTASFWMSSICINKTRLGHSAIELDSFRFERLGLPFPIHLRYIILFEDYFHFILCCFFFKFSKTVFVTELNSIDSSQWWSSKFHILKKILSNFFSLDKTAIFSEILHLWPKQHICSPFGGNFFSERQNIRFN